MTFPLDWKEIPPTKRYGMPTYQRTDGVLVAYNLNKGTWDAYWSSTEDPPIGAEALHPRAAIDHVDAVYKIKVEQRIVQIAFSPHNQLYALTDAGSVYRLNSSHAQRWEPVWLPALPAISQE